jgi:hypothetical protein
MREIGAPAQVVWELLVNTDRWAEWGPSIRAVEVDGRLARGSEGRVQTVVGVWLPFRVTGYDEGTAWTWQVAGVPATSHRVDALGPSRCRAGFGVPWFAVPYLPVCAVALRRIEGRARERHA